MASPASPPTTTPQLTPSFCFHPTALQDFLRLSRSYTDDTISQNLNALLTPSRTPYDPNNSIPSRQQRRLVPSPGCTTFTRQILFPAWSSRTEALSYCSDVACSQDPLDPEFRLRMTEDAAAAQRVVDERLDPYSGRYFPRQTRAERLASLLRNEIAVEEIVRKRTWAVIQERCQDGVAGDERFFTPNLGIPTSDDSSGWKTDGRGVRR